MTTPNKRKVVANHEVMVQAEEGSPTAAVFIRQPGGTQKEARLPIAGLIAGGLSHQDALAFLADAVAVGIANARLAD